MSNVLTVTRTERGWGGHFICASRCLYRRNTLLTKGAKHIVVSSVGLLKIDKQIESIGFCDGPRFYETMAFRGEHVGPYIEADVTEQLSFEPTWYLCAKDAESLPHDADLQMDRQHEAVVDWLSANFDAAWEQTSDK